MPEEILKSKETEPIKEVKPTAPVVKIDKPAPEEKGEIHTYVIVDDKGEESGGFKGKYPRQAALKVARTLGAPKDKPATFKIRERGTKKLHVFSGYIEMVKTPEKRPKWMKDMVKKPVIHKIGVEKIEKEPK